MLSKLDPISPSSEMGVDIYMKALHLVDNKVMEVKEYSDSIINF